MRVLIPVAAIVAVQAVGFQAAPECGSGNSKFFGGFGEAPTGAVESFDDGFVFSCGKRSGFGARRQENGFTDLHTVDAESIHSASQARELGHEYLGIGAIGWDLAQCILGSAIGIDEFAFTVEDGDAFLDGVQDRLGERREYGRAVLSRVDHDIKNYALRCLQVSKLIEIDAALVGWRPLHYIDRVASQEGTW